MFSYLFIPHIFIGDQREPKVVPEAEYSKGEKTVRGLK